MKAPIYDFIKSYIEKDTSRFHMPGHKGSKILGFEQLDITEFEGADSLFSPNGIIEESEKNATELFESGRTVYSCEGSSLCIRTMLHLIKLYMGDGYVLAGRNAHSSFISACALNDIDVKWIYPKDNQSYLSCFIDGSVLENHLSCVDKLPICVFVTSPDYLGNMCDIKSISEVCQRYNIPLVVDNAHGAYLKFLKEDLHPITLGATMCCDSAHKTLPVLTGGAYLHISKNAPSFFMNEVKNAMSLFASTSPSYLILSSLDKANTYLSTEFKEDLNSLVSYISENFSSYIDTSSCLKEPIKILLETKKFGYRGKDFSKILMDNNIVCEFCDEDFVVLMISTKTSKNDLIRLKKTLDSIEKMAPIKAEETLFSPPKKALSIREATFSKRERINIDQALGRTLAVSSITCPPAVSLIVSGEEFNESTIKLCKKYGFSSCYVLKK